VSLYLAICKRCILLLYFLFDQNGILLARYSISTIRLCVFEHAILFDTSNFVWVLLDVFIWLQRYQTCFIWNSSKNAFTYGTLC
jgi:hypothetical protein